MGSLEARLPGIVLLLCMWWKELGKLAGGLSRTSFMGMPPLQSLRVLWTPARGFMLCFHAAEIHINFEERAPFVNLHCALQIMWPVLRLSPCRCPMAACWLRCLQHTGW